MTRDTIPTLDDTWQGWRALLPVWPPEEQRAGLMLLRELAKGEPVGAARLARALGAPTAEAEALVRGSGLSPFVYADDDGRAVGFLGLSTARTRHRFAIDGRTLWTWCAQDTLFLPELLGATAQVESSDPETGEPVRLTVSPRGIVAVEPRGVAVSMVRPDTADLTSAARIIATACHFIFFFASRATGERWAAAHPQTVLLSLDEAFTLAKRQNAA
ncbi:MAG: organomercurial lyase, partial [Gemmatimonadota bacterium]